MSERNWIERIQGPNGLMEEDQILDEILGATPDAVSELIKLINTRVANSGNIFSGMLRGAALDTLCEIYLDYHIPSAKKMKSVLFKLIDPKIEQDEEMRWLAYTQIWDSRKAGLFDRKAIDRRLCKDPSPDINWWVSTTSNPGLSS